MGAGPWKELTLALGRSRAGDKQARVELIAPVYDELRQVASRLMRRERTGHTLSATAVVHEALDQLAALNKRQARVMPLRDFGRLTIPEVAAALGVSPVTVERDRRLAQAWLRDQLGKGDE